MIRRKKLAVQAVLIGMLMVVGVLVLYQPWPVTTVEERFLPGRTFHNFVQKFQRPFIQPGQTNTPPQQSLLDADALPATNLSTVVEVPTLYNDTLPDHDKKETNATDLKPTFNLTTAIRQSTSNKTAGTKQSVQHTGPRISLPLYPWSVDLGKRQQDEVRHVVFVKVSVCYVFIGCLVSSVVSQAIWT